MSETAIIREAKKRFRQCNKWAKIIDRERLKEAIATCGDQWGKPPTAEQVLSAIDIAGFRIVRKPR